MCTQRGCQNLPLLLGLMVTLSNCLLNTQAYIHRYVFLAVFVRENFMVRTAVNANVKAIMVSRIINGGVLIPQKQYLYYPPRFMKHCKRRDKKNEPEHGRYAVKRSLCTCLSPCILNPLHLWLPSQPSSIDEGELMWL